VAPLIPFIHLPDLVLLPAHALHGFPPVPVALKPFGTLVACGVYFGTSSAVRHARRLGMNEKAMVSFLTYVVVISFVLGHMLDTLTYYPREVLRDPLVLFRLWEGLSSFGGFTGSIVAGVAWRLRHRTPVLAYADMVAASFPVSWSFGRLGCTVAHDHPGLRSEAWFAVRYPDGGRFDLGLYELVVTIIMMIVFLGLARRPRPWGFFSGWMCASYAPIRFLLDFLRVREFSPVPGLLEGGDARYFALTPAQWGCLPLFALGVFLILRSRSQGTALPAVPAAFRRSGPKPERMPSDTG